MTATDTGSGLVDQYMYDLLGQRLTHWNNVLGADNVERSDYDGQGRVVKTRAFGADNTRYDIASVIDTYVRPDRNGRWLGRADAHRQRQGIARA